MIGYPALRKIVGSDLRASVAAAHQAFTMPGNFFFLLADLLLVQSCTHHLHGFFRLPSWDLSVWQTTTVPVGIWVSITLVSTLFTFWPPAPPLRAVSIFTSAGFNSKSTSSASGITATVAADVWTRPLVSVSEHAEPGEPHFRISVSHKHLPLSLQAELPCIRPLFLRFRSEWPFSNLSFAISQIHS